MANKKCPKCGEDNPAEAVMCWACYTPLTAGAGAAMGAGGMAGGAGAATLPRPGGPMGAAGAPEEGGKKEIDPKIFVLGGLLLVGAVVALFTTGVLGGSAPPDIPVGGGTQGPTDVMMPSTQPQNTSSSSGPIVSPPIGGAASDSGNTQPPGPPPPAYSMVVSPNPSYKIATFGITPSTATTSDNDAVALARSAREAVGRGGKWQSMQIFVFKDAASAGAFRTYMGQRRGQPLSSSDFSSLAGQGAWDGAIVYYNSTGKAAGAKVAFPYKNPTRWW